MQQCIDKKVFDTNFLQLGGPPDLSPPTILSQPSDNSASTSHHAAAHRPTQSYSDAANNVNVPHIHASFSHTQQNSHPATFHADRDSQLRSHTRSNVPVLSADTSYPVVHQPPYSAVVRMHEYTQLHSYTDSSVANLSRNALFTTNAEPSIHTYHPENTSSSVLASFQDGACVHCQAALPIGKITQSYHVTATETPPHGLVDEDEAGCTNLSASNLSASNFCNDSQLNTSASHARAYDSQSSSNAQQVQVQVFESSICGQTRQHVNTIRSILPRTHNPPDSHSPSGARLIQKEHLSSLFEARKPPYRDTLAQPVEASQYGGSTQEHSAYAVSNRGGVVEESLISPKGYDSEVREMISWGTQARDISGEEVQTLNASRSPTADTITVSEIPSGVRIPQSHTL